MVGRRKYFYFIPQMGNYTYRNCSSCKVMQNPWKQRGTETLSLESQTVPKRLFTFDHEITPHCSVFASPRWQLVECYKCCSLLLSSNSAPAWGRQTFTGELLPYVWLGPGEMCIKVFSWLANLKEKDVFLGGGGGYCLLNIISFLLLLTQPIASLQSDVRNWEQNSN